MMNVPKFVAALAIIVLGGLVISIIATMYALTNAKTQLASTKEELTVTTAELDSTTKHYNAVKTELSSTQAKLDSTIAQLGDAKRALVTTQARLQTAESQLQTAKAEKGQMEVQYAELRKNVSVKLGDTLKDKQSFLAPSDSSVSSKVQEITSGYTGDNAKLWQDYQKLYQWVVRDIKYSHDSSLPVLPQVLSGAITWSKDYWRTPSETLADKTGDCEDMAVLLYSMLRNYNQGKFGVWVISISSTTPERKGHVAVAFPVEGGKLTILDPAGKYSTSYPWGPLRSDLVSDAVNSWLSYWASDMPGAMIDGVFSETLGQEFSSTSEFLTWCSKQ